MNENGKILRKFIIFLIVIALIIVGLGIALPGFLWTRDLGVNYTKNDYNSIMEKLNYTKDDAPTGSLSEYTYTYGEVTHISTSFTSEELTAFFSENRPSYYALKNVQIKINEDSIEAVASVNVDYFLTELLANKYTKEDINKNFPAMGLVPENVNLYLNFEGSVIDNQATLKLNSATVQGISVPDNFISNDGAINTLRDGLNEMMGKYNTKTGSSFDKIAIEGGKLVVIGDYPSSLTRVLK